MSFFMCSHKTSPKQRVWTSCRFECETYASTITKDAECTVRWCFSTISTQTAFSSRCDALTILLQRLACNIKVGGAKWVSDESPPPSQVIFPVVETPEVVQLTVTRDKVTGRLDSAHVPQWWSDYSCYVLITYTHTTSRWGGMTTDSGLY